MTRRLHMSLSVRGALCNWTKRDWTKHAKHMRRSDGALYDGPSLKEAFLDELAQGREMLLVGDACDNFDDKTGCRGHQTEEAP